MSIFSFTSSEKEIEMFRLESYFTKSLVDISVLLFCQCNYHLGLLRQLLYRIGLHFISSCVEESHTSVTIQYPKSESEMFTVRLDIFLLVMLVITPLFN